MTPLETNPSIATSGKPRQRPIIVGLIAVLLGMEALILLACAALTFYVSDSSSITVNDFKVTMGESRGYVFAGFFLIGALLAISSRGFWRGQSLSRFIALAVHAAVPLLLLIQEPEWAGWLQWIFGCMLVGWYLFLKSNVRAFFRKAPIGDSEDES